MTLPATVDATQTLLAGQGYICDRALATLSYLALTLQRPIFLEGEAGVGKTELAKVLASALGRDLIRLQCYEGLDANSAIAEWNFAAQMLALKGGSPSKQDSGSNQFDQNVLSGDSPERGDSSQQAVNIYDDRFLLKRPLLRAMEPHEAGPPVLLIDEVDRTDAPFEAFLLEALSDFQVTVPELGTVKAAQPPIVILTSNRTREVHDALKRRCLYHWVDYPEFDRELAILKARIPEVNDALSRELVAFVQHLRREDVYKKPGLAETLDWAKCLVALDAVALSPEVVSDTLGALLKYQDDIAKLQSSELTKMIESARSELNNPGVV